MSLEIEHLQTSGTFSLDGGTWNVDNNVWLIGDGDEVVIIDAAHDADAIVQAVNGRRVKAIIATHAHDDHINVGAPACRGHRRARPAASRRPRTLEDDPSRS